MTHFKVFKPNSLYLDPLRPDFTGSRVGVCSLTYSNIPTQIEAFELNNQCHCDICCKLLVSRSHVRCFLSIFTYDTPCSAPEAQFLLDQLLMRHLDCLLELLVQYYILCTQYEHRWPSLYV